MEELSLFAKLCYSGLGVFIIIFGIWFSTKIPQTQKKCKQCSSIELEHFAGIGADGIICLRCQKIQ